MCKIFTKFFLLLLCCSQIIHTSYEEKIPSLFHITTEYIIQNLDLVDLKELGLHPILLPHLVKICFQQKLIPPLVIENKEKHTFKLCIEPLPYSGIIYDRNRCCTLTLQYQTDPYNFDLIPTHVALETPTIHPEELFGLNESSAITCTIQIDKHEPQLIAIGRENGLISIFEVEHDIENHVATQSNDIYALSHDETTNYLLTFFYSPTPEQLHLTIIHPHFPNFLIIQDAIESLIFYNKNKQPRGNKFYSCLPKEIFDLIPHRYLAGNFTPEESFLLLSYAQTLMQFNHNTLIDQYKKIQKALQKKISKCSLEPVVRKQLVQNLKKAILSYKNDYL